MQCWQGCSTSQLGTWVQIAAGNLKAVQRGAELGSCSKDEAACRFQG